MADAVRQEEVDAPRFLGGIYVLVEQAYRDADYESLMTAVQTDLQRDHAEYFSEESGPDGSSWPPLATRTIQRKGHDSILFETGALRESLTGDVSGAVRNTTHRGLVFGTSVPYSIFHQQGAGRLPQRAHVGVTEQRVEAITEQVADALVDKLKP
jgi:phage gpG-like protein